MVHDHQPNYKVYRKIHLEYRIAAIAKHMCYNILSYLIKYAINYTYEK